MTFQTRYLCENGALYVHNFLFETKNLIWYTVNMCIVIHNVKSVQTRSFFYSLFYRIQFELSKNKDQKKLRIGPFLRIDFTEHYTSTIYTSQICQITWSEILKVRAKTCKLSMETDACYMNVNQVTLKLFSSKIITFRHQVLLREQTEKYFLS